MSSLAQASADQIQARDAMFELVVGNARSDFLTFVRLVAPQLVADFKMGRHIEVICQKLQQVEEGSVKRLMVFLPPRSSKSVICSKLFPAWYIGRHSNHEILQSLILTSLLVTLVALFEMSLILKYLN